MIFTFPQKDAAPSSYSPTGWMQGGAGSNLIFSGYSVKAAQNEGFLKSRLSPICEVRWGVTEAGAGRPFQQDEG